jgi:hypothetical protein
LANVIKIVNSGINFEKSRTGRNKSFEDEKLAKTVSSRRLLLKGEDKKIYCRLWRTPIASCPYPDRLFCLQRRTTGHPCAGRIPRGRTQKKL